MYGTWFALVVKIDDYEGEFYPETKQPTYKMIRAWIRERYGFTVNSASISQTKKKYGLIADTEGRYVQKVCPEKETAIREAFIWFGILKKLRKRRFRQCLDVFFCPYAGVYESALPTIKYGNMEERIIEKQKLSLAAALPWYDDRVAAVRKNNNAPLAGAAGEPRQYGPREIYDYLERKIWKQEEACIYRKPRAMCTEFLSQATGEIEPPRRR